ncbi:BH0788 [Halalkalibacterium halodurans C-125]|nr:BH0788 [Halalkalibacterium halodurans C-125]
MKKTAHIISHSHWDREWYMPFEGHRYYLIQLMDDLLELFATDPNFRSFHMDGQTIMLEDYLNIRPEKEAEVRKYIQDGRLVIGPWYILQDAFLTSAEANVRNLLYGIKDTETFGQKREQIGYFSRYVWYLWSGAPTVSTSRYPCGGFWEGCDADGVQ